MKDFLRELSALSARLGNDLTLVQGAGGNTSLKMDGVLWVKASGKWLAVAENEDIFVGLDLAKVRARIAAGCGDSLADTVVSAPGGLRPSIETTLHALLPHAVVLHVHSVRAIALAVREDAAAQFSKRLAGLPWKFVPYSRPGLPLTESVQAALSHGSAHVLILGNHGLVVGGGNCAEAEALLHDVERRLETPVRDAFVPDDDALAGLVDGTGYILPAHRACHGLAAAGAVGIAGKGSLYPDHVVFLGPSVGVSDAIPPRPARPGMAPPGIWVVPGKGILTRSDLSEGAVAMVQALALVIDRIPDDVRVSYLSAGDENELLGWEAEKYRQVLTK